MRKGLRDFQQNENTNIDEINSNNKYKIMAVDDEEGIIDSLSIFLKRSGYNFTGVTNPVEAIEKLKNEHYDLLILDFIMTPFHGDQVVEEIRKFDKELYILLLTGHKDLAPPLETIRRLDIQGYCEKSDKFDQLLLLIESGIKSISQMKEIKKINSELKDTYDKLEKAFTFSPSYNFRNAIDKPNAIGISIINCIIDIAGSKSSGNKPVIKPSIKKKAKYAKIIRAPLPHFPDNFLRASALKSDDIILKSPFRLYLYYKNYYKKSTK